MNNVYYHYIYSAPFQIKINTGCFESIEEAREIFNRGNQLRDKKLVGFFKCTAKDCMEYEFIKELI